MGRPGQTTATGGGKGGINIVAGGIHLCSKKGHAIVNTEKRGAPTKFMGMGKLGELWIEILENGTGKPWMRERGRGKKK